ncbi:glucocorticoid-induced transcript 1 protein-like [Sinocyclocheilus rhinocerous]|uniref:glucocorticoid-induced transcript 1 protein-like n=1 Tax=Sinocyclocheilus rhinocerous TaxID=307959 RepID=UPI0007B8A2CE|nr:PREDICTED: glucocorticoid-induced transcript 1 protein-like [Sinocyclocheilus rhinocerous]
MNTFSVLVLEFIIVSRAHLRIKCNSNSRLQPVSASVPLRWSDQTRSASFSSSRHSRSPSSSSSHAANMKQITKPTRIPSESHFITAGRARSASRQPPSLDKLPEQYLIGQWPREPYQPQASCMSDKATQVSQLYTEDGGEVIVHKRSASWGSADHLIEIAKLRQQLQRSLQGSHSIEEKEEAPAQFFLCSTCRTQGFPIFSCPDRNKVNFTPSGSAFCPVKLLCSSLFPSDDAARPSSLDTQTSGQTSGPFTEASVQNSFPLRPVSSECCSIRKCLLLS